MKHIQLSLLNKNSKNKKPTKQIKLGSLFSGIGAIEQALQKLNYKYKIVYASDSDKFVKESYFSNYKISEKQWFEDIKLIDGNKFKYKTDLVVGGPPCQPFSMVGNRKGLEDTRGTLFYDFAKLVKESKPKVFIFENVRGIFSLQRGKTWKKILETFGEFGYHLHYSILNSKDYGIPQSRERVFLVGFRKKTDFWFPEKRPLKNKMQDYLEDIKFDSKYSLSQKGINFVSNTENLKKQYTQINGDIALCQKSRQQYNWHGDFIHENGSHTNKYFLSEKVKTYVLKSGTKTFNAKPETDLPVARAIISTMHKMHRAGVDNYITEGDRIRKLTPRECLRLMGFPDKFKQVVSDTQMYKQAGNSIVVDVLSAILKQIDFDNLK